MTTAPYVELRFNPTDLRPGDLPYSGAYLGSSANAIEAALAVTRTAMVRQVRADLRGVASPTHAQMLRILDLAWQGVFWKFRKISAPIMADAYLHAYRQADAGDVPISLIYELADKHAEKIGDYFHESSRAGLADGFNTLVNRRIPAKAAADRVLDAYGLTPRQMRAYVSASQFDTPVSDVMPRSIKAKARAYIDKAFTTRLRKLSVQEEHNIDEQAKQFAWMWLQDKGRLSPRAEKLWITAKDERVCPICGPLHGQKVRVGERFKTAQGEFWTPGLHPNCRCVVRLLEHRFTIEKAATALADDWDPREHPRDKVGRFSLARGATIDVDSEFDRIVDQQILKKPPTHPKYSAVGRTHDADLAMLFHDVVQGATWEAPTVVHNRLARPAPQKPAPTMSPIQIEATKLSSQIVPIQAQVVFTTTLASRLRATASPETKPKVLPATKTKPARAVIGKTVYGVTTSREHIPGKPEAFKMDKVTFTSSPEEAAALAARLIKGDVDDAIGRIMERGAVFRAHDGNQYRLTRDQVKNVVEWYARTEPTEHIADIKAYDPPFDDAITTRGVAVRREGEPGRPGYKTFSTREIGAELGLDTGLFDTVVFKAKEGHADRTHHLEGHDPKLPETWRLEGNFRIKWNTVDVTQHEAFTSNTYEIEPILEVDEGD